MSVEIETVHKSERDHSEELEEKIVYDNDATATMDREDSIRGLPLARVEIRIHGLDWPAKEDPRETVHEGCIRPVEQDLSSQNAYVGTCICCGRPLCVWDLSRTRSTVGGEVVRRRAGSRPVVWCGRRARRLRLLDVDCGGCRCPAGPSRCVCTGACLPPACALRPWRGEGHGAPCSCGVRLRDTFDHGRSDDRVGGLAAMDASRRLAAACCTRRGLDRRGC